MTFGRNMATESEFELQPNIIDTNKPTIDLIRE